MQSVTIATDVRVSANNGRWDVFTWVYGFLYWQTDHLNKVEIVDFTMIYNTSGVVMTNWC